MPLYREVAEGLIAWVTEVLSDPARGGFYASQDADQTLDDDGDYFTWTVAGSARRAHPGRSCASMEAVLTTFSRTAKCTTILPRMCSGSP